jgi:hypothetical protein
VFQWSIDLKNIPIMPPKPQTPKYFSEFGSIFPRGYDLFSIFTPVAIPTDSRCHYLQLSQLLGESAVERRGKDRKITLMQRKRRKSDVNGEETRWPAPSLPGTSSCWMGRSRAG